MGNITVSVVPTNSFTITLGKADWINLKVNGVDVSPYDDPDGDIGFLYTANGPINFTAKTDNVTIVNPGSLMVLNGAEPGEAYSFQVGYGETGDGSTIFLTGHLESSPGASGQDGPIQFSQDNLEGTFELA